MSQNSFFEFLQNARDSGRSRAVFICLFAAIMIVVDWAAVFGFSPSDDRQVPTLVGQDASPGYALDTEGREFLLRQYDTAVTEIQMRLAQESFLFGLKFTLAGAILAVVFSHEWHRRTTESNTKEGGEQSGDDGSNSHAKTHVNKLFASPLVALFFWAAIVTNGIVDCRIMYHVDVIVQLGEWIKTNVEPVLLSPPKPNGANGDGDNGYVTTNDGEGSSEDVSPATDTGPTISGDSTNQESLKRVVGWEEFFSSSDLITSISYPFLRMNTHLFTLIQFALVLVGFSGKLVGWDDPGETVSSICRWGACGSLFVMFLSAVHFHYTSVAWWAWCTVWLLIGIGQSWRAFHVPKTATLGSETSD